MSVRIVIQLECHTPYLMSPKQITLAATLFLIALLFCLKLWNAKEPSRVSVFEHELQNVEQSASNVPLGVVGVATTSVVEAEMEPTVEGRQAVEVKAPIDLLGELLPEWLRDGGMQFQDQRELNGHIVLRSRARYEWEGGEQLEIEITDVGTAPDLELLKGLGFNPDLEDLETESGFSLTQDEESYIVNQEYDFDDQSGSLQVLVESRYLIEIQIQQLPDSAFQEVLDSEIPFEAIFQKLDNASDTM